MPFFLSMHTKKLDFLLSFLTILITAITFFLAGIHTMFYMMNVAMRVGWTEIQYKRRKLSSLRLPHRLGTLQSLPYEIRQHIFMMLLIGSINEHYQNAYKYDKRFNRLGPIDWEEPKILELRFQWKGDDRCCMLGNQKPAFSGVFNLASYCGFRPKLKRMPLNIRLASHSIQAEFDYMFLTRSTFAFECPTALNVFLAHLTPLRQDRLRHLKLRMFKPGFWSCSERCRNKWLYQCRKLPPKLLSVDFVVPYRLKFIYQNWIYGSMHDENASLEDAAEVLKVFCTEVVRAAPRARILFSGQLQLATVERDEASLGLALVRLRRINERERDVLDAMRRGIEPWRKFLIAWLDVWNA